METGLLTHHLTELDVIIKLLWADKNIPQKIYMNNVQKWGVF